MPYCFIEDLPQELVEFTSDLGSLSAAWEARRTELGNRDELRSLHEGLRRKWAIDTGMIEGLYSIDRGTTELLIDRGLQADLIAHGSTDLPPSQIAAYLHDQAQVYDSLFDFIRRRRGLTTAYVKEVHQLLTRNQDSTEALDQFGHVMTVPLMRGEWKQLPNNPRRPDGTVHDYCPPDHVAAEMDRLLDLHEQHVASDVAPEVEAAWLHHRFTQIHPFQDGNGRVARSLATLVLIREARFPFSVAPEDKTGYIDALERADAGDLGPLLDLITESQRRAFLNALSVAQNLDDQQQIFDAALAKATRTRELRAAEFAEVKALGTAVTDAIGSDLEARRNEFNARLSDRGLGEVYQARFHRAQEMERRWYIPQIIESAKSLDYFADTQEFSDWVRLSIVCEDTSRAVLLVAATHAIGRSFKGVLATLAFVEVTEQTGEGRHRRGPYVACDTAFTFGYLDQQEHVIVRAKEWLHPVWLSMLRTWEETL